MRIRKSLISLAAAGSAVALLSGCASSYTIQSLTVTSKVNGNIDLTTFDPSIAPFGVLPEGSPRTIPSYSTGTAKASITASFAGGNWNVSGTWADGDVQMKFKGYALEIAELGPWSTAVSDMKAGINSFDASLAKSVGGMCMPILTHYTSTNYARPGAGWAMIVVCDSPGRYTNPDFDGSFPEWTSPDYVKIHVPVINSGDLNPFGNYMSGGYMGYKGSTTNSIAVSCVMPSYSPTPSWDDPCSTGSASSSSSSGGPWSPCPSADGAAS